MTNDIGVLPTGGVPQIGKLLNKPMYLLTLTGKSNSFISIDSPEILNGFVLVKGFYYSENDRDYIRANYIEIISNTDKTNFVEVHIPFHKINEICNLVYRQR